MAITKAMIRCKHCSYLVEDDDGDWYCDNYEKKCELIKFCGSVESDLVEEEWICETQEED